MEGICCFCGHGIATEDIQAPLMAAVEELIVTGKARIFYVGNHGAFERIAAGVLRKMKDKYPEIEYAIVLAYLPGPRQPHETLRRKEIDTVFPEGLELVPKRYAIVHRNRWMVEQSDYMIAYVNHNFGGAAQTYAYTLRRGLSIINLGLTSEK